MKRPAMLLFECLQERQLYRVGEGLREPVQIHLVLLGALSTHGVCLQAWAALHGKIQSG
jgi:hypothetical protein